MTYIQGIDISKHQGTVDFNKVAKSGMRFCICKATEGRGYTDPKFKENWAKLVAMGHETQDDAGAPKLGMYRGAYHFARPSSDGGGAADGEAEASAFCAVIKSVGDYGAGMLPPVLDFEEYTDDNVIDNVPWIQAFVNVVAEELNRTTMIYTGRNVWRYEVGNTDKFIHLPLWQVDYHPTRTKPTTTPWPKWALWQWSGGGKYAYAKPTPGIKGGVVDVNRFNGTENDLAALAGIVKHPVSLQDSDGVCTIR